jgi:hypothetical protein
VGFSRVCRVWAPRPCHNVTRNGDETPLVTLTTLSGFNVTTISPAEQSVTLTTLSGANVTRDRASAQRVTL